MTQQQDSISELRAAFTIRKLKNVKFRLPSGPSGPSGIFIQLALAVIFIYLLVIAYLMMGAVGAVLVSIMFLFAFFVPVLYQRAQQSWRRRKRFTDESDREILESEMQQKG